MMTRRENLNFLAKTSILKTIDGNRQVGFLVYRGIPDLEKMSSALSDSMNEVKVKELDDNDSFVYFPKIAGIDAAVIINGGFSHMPDTIVFELSRMSRMARKVIEDLQ